MWWLALSVSLFFPITALANNYSGVVFNEIAWMGNQESGSKEWLELYNNTDFLVSLDNWKITAADGIPNITLKGSIPSHGFYLLERTSDQTLPGISANQIYTGTLENIGENLKLIDQNNNLIDEIIATDGWPGGDNSTKQTMETLRQAQGENRVWQTSQNPGGTPGSKNSVLSKTNLSPTPSTPPVLAPSLSPTVQKLNYAQGIVFNEILVSPSGPDETEEWLELFNKNDFLVDLSGWKISDSFGKTKEYSFPENSLVPPQEYLVIRRPESGIVLNNQEEKLILSSPDNQIIDSVYYKGSVLSQSLARFSDQWSWTKTLTPGSLNIQSDHKSKEQEESVINENAEEEVGLAAKAVAKEIKQDETKKLSPLKIFGLALLVASLSGTAILMLKRLIEDNKLY